MNKVVGFGEKVQERLDRLGWTFERAAERTGIAASTVHNMTRGWQVSEVTLRRWAAAVGDDPGEWLRAAAYREEVDGTGNVCWVKSVEGTIPKAPPRLVYPGDITFMEPPDRRPVTIVNVPAMHARPASPPGATDTTAPAQRDIPDEELLQMLTARYDGGNEGILLIRDIEKMSPEDRAEVYKFVRAYLRTREAAK